MSNVKPCPYKKKFENRKAILKFIWCSVWTQQQHNLKKICTFRLICVGSVLHPRLTKMQQLPGNKKFFTKVTNCMTKMTQPIR